MQGGHKIAMCPPHAPQYGELRPTSSWDRFGSLEHPSIFQRLRVWASLLQRCHSSEANQILHDVWCLLGCYAMYTFLGTLARGRNFAKCKIYFASKSCVLLYWQRYCTALEQRPSVKLCSMLQGMELHNFSRGHHLYSAGQGGHHVEHRPTF